RYIGHRGAEETFTAGLLHDMGKAIFYRFFRNKFLDAVRAAQAESIDLLTAERRFFDTDHACAGAVVAVKWNLPTVLMHAIQYHHAPLSLADDIDPSSRKTVYLVHIADVLSEHYQIGRGLEIDVRAIDNAVWEYLGIDLGVCQDLLGEVLGEVSEFRSICDLFVSPQKKTPVAAAKPAPSPTANPVKATPQSAPTQNPPVASAAAPASGQGVNRLMDGVKQLALLAGVDDLCPNIAEQAKNILDADAACVFLPHGDDLDNVGAAGFPQLFGKRFAIAQSWAGWVAKMGEIMTVTDIDKAQASWEKSLFSAVGYRSHLILPIDWAGKRIAVLSIHSVRQRKWSTEQISLAQTFCGFVAVVLENSGLYREAEERAKALEGLNQELQAALNVKMRFLGKVSHELRSPLCVITGYANLLADQTFGPLSADGAKSVQRILGQSDA
ncbi:MAG: HDOD domain-containing protein, partial [Candidatus Binatia bacterium]